MAAMELPPGYRLELVASEPMIHEPAVIAWDGNGRMYVAEMRTYMQDIDGSDELAPKSRISLLDDTDGDGTAPHAHAGQSAASSRLCAAANARITDTGRRPSGAAPASAAPQIAHPPSVVIEP